MPARSDPNRWNRPSRAASRDNPSQKPTENPNATAARTHNGPSPGVQTATIQAINPDAEPIPCPRIPA